MRALVGWLAVTACGHAAGMLRACCGHDCVAPPSQLSRSRVVTAPSRLPCPLSPRLECGRLARDVRVVSIDFTTLNPNLGVACLVRLVLALPTTGSIESTVFTMTFLRDPARFQPSLSFQACFGGGDVCWVLVWGRVYVWLWVNM